MDDLNKIISFILGLVVVVVLLVILASRFNLREKLLPLSGLNKTTVTPTPKGQAKKTTVKTTPTPTSSITKGTPDYRPYQTSTSGKVDTTLSTIPKTGSPTMLVPLALLFLTGGVFLSKKK